MVRPTVPRSVRAQLVQREARANASTGSAVRRHVCQSMATVAPATRARLYSAPTTSRLNDTSAASPAAPERSTWYTSPADSFDAEVSAHDDIRSRILEASLPFIPSTGFSLRTLQAGAAALQQSGSSGAASFSPLALDQLFPSPAPRSFSLPLSRLFRRAAAQTQEEGERIGPSRALFDAWAAQGRQQLRAAIATDGTGSEKPDPLASVRKAFRQRLEYNLPVLQFLPEAIATLSVPDPSKASLPSFSGYKQYSQAIAGEILSFARAEASLTRLQTVYTLAEVYQLSPSRPSFEQVMAHLDRLIEQSAGWESGVRDTMEFAEYVMRSWRGIIKARGL